MSKDFPTFDEKFSIAILEEGVRALLLGGVACNIYGSSRASEDTDWWIDPTQGIQQWINTILVLCRRTTETCSIIRLKDRRIVGNCPKDGRAGRLLQIWRAALCRRLGVRSHETFSRELFNAARLCIPS